MATSFQQLFDQKPTTPLVQNDLLQRLADKRLAERRQLFESRVERSLEKMSDCYTIAVQSLRDARRIERERKDRVTQYNRALAYLESTGNPLPVLFLIDPYEARQACSASEIEINESTFSVPDHFEMPQNWAPSISV